LGLRITILTYWSWHDTTRCKYLCGPWQWQCNQRESGLKTWPMHQQATMYKAGFPSNATHATHATYATPRT